MINTPSTLSVKTAFSTGILGSLRYLVSIVVVCLFLFPVFWWALTSIKPPLAIFDREKTVVLDFQPTWANYGTIFGFTDNMLMQGLSAIKSSCIIAVGSTILTLIIGLAGAYGFSRMMPRRCKGLLSFFLIQRAIPPIVIAIPLVLIFRDFGLYDTHLGVIFAHSLINLPLAVLLLKSFVDDIPVDIDHAAMIDGASRLQCFCKILLPMMRGGIAATAVLCFVFSWTEFILTIFLANTIQTIPIKVTTFSSWTFGYSSALGTTAMLPTFIFILLFQRVLVRGLTVGTLKY